MRSSDYLDFAGFGIFIKNFIKNIKKLLTTDKYCGIITQKNKQKHLFSPYGEGFAVNIKVLIPIDGNGCYASVFLVILNM